MGAYNVLPLFALGSYLGAFGLGLVFSSVLASGPPGLRIATGLGLLAVAMVAIMASVLQSVAWLQADTRPLAID